MKKLKEVALASTIGVCGLATVLFVTGVFDSPNETTTETLPGAGDDIQPEQTSHPSTTESSNSKGSFGDSLKTFKKEYEKRRKPAQADQDQSASKKSNNIFTVKGMHIGMTEPQIKSRLRELFGSKLKFKKQKRLFKGHLALTYFTLKGLTHDYREESFFSIDTRSQKVWTINIASGHLDHIFKTETLKFSDFSQQFLSFYNIKSMKPEQAARGFKQYSTMRGNTKITLYSSNTERMWKQFALDYIPVASFK